MAGTFTVVETGRVHGINGILAYGTYVAAGGNTGGTITPSLAVINLASVDPLGSSDTPYVNQVAGDFPISGQTGFLVVCGANASGAWQASGA